MCKRLISCFIKKFYSTIENNNINKKEFMVTFKKMKNITDTNNIPYFSFFGKVFYGKACHIYDGDTFSIIFDYKGDLVKYRCRSIGYDSPEIKPLLINPNRELEKELAIKARNRLTELIYKNNPQGILKIECENFDKYGRILVRFYNLDDALSINDIMLKEGHGRPYHGGKKNTAEW